MSFLVPQEDPNQSKMLKQGTLKLQRRRSQVFGKLKDKSVFLMLVERFDELWERSYVLEVYAKEGAKKCEKIVMDENARVEPHGVDGFSVKAAKTSLVFKSDSQEQAAEWLEICQQWSGAGYPTENQLGNRHTQDPAPLGNVRGRQVAERTRGGSATCASVLSS